MRIIVSLSFIFMLLACQSSSKLNYQLIRDNLYKDQAGNLYLKTIDRSAADSGDPILDAKHTYDRWLNVVYCEACLLKTDNEEVPGLAYLKEKVDVASFHHVATDKQGGGDIYEDKNYRYFHKWMADGGTISLEEKTE